MTTTVTREIEQLFPDLASIGDTELRGRVAEHATEITKLRKASDSASSPRDKNHTQ